MTNLKYTIMKKIKAIIEKANDGGISVYSEDTVLGLQSRKRKMILCPYLKSRLNIIKKNMETFLCGISLGILLITYMI